MVLILMKQREKMNGVMRTSSFWLKYSFFFLFCSYLSFLMFYLLIITKIMASSIEIFKQLAQNNTPRALTNSHNYKSTRNTIPNHSQRLSHFFPQENSQLSPQKHKDFTKDYSFKKQSLITQCSYKEPQNKTNEKIEQMPKILDFTFNATYNQQSDNKNLLRVLTNTYHSHKILNITLYSLLFNHIYLLNQTENTQREFSSITQQADNIMEKIISLFKDHKQQLILHKKAIKSFYRFIKSIKQENIQNQNHLISIVDLFHQQIFQSILLKQHSHRQVSIDEGVSAQDGLMMQQLSSQLGIQIKLSKKNMRYSWGLSKDSKIILNLRYSTLKESYCLQQIQYKLDEPL